MINLDSSSVFGFISIVPSKSPDKSNVFSIPVKRVFNCFDESKSDFSSLCPDFKDPIFISKIEHGVRVAIDEEGVTATAYTVEMLAGSARPTEEEIDFVLDRPFVFVITSDDGLPLFIGVVNQP